MVLLCKRVIRRIGRRLARSSYPDLVNRLKALREQQV